MKSYLFPILFFLIFSLIPPLQAEISSMHPILQRALRKHWPKGQIEAVSCFLKKEEIKELGNSLGSRRIGRLHTYYIMRKEKDSPVQGYAFFDTHLIRSQTETLLYTLSPKPFLSGRGKQSYIRSIEPIVFYEPEEYRPPANWLEQFYNRMKFGDDGVLEKNVDFLTGATLTRQAVIRSVARTLSLYRLCIPSGRGSKSKS